MQKQEAMKLKIEYGSSFSHVSGINKSHSHMIIQVHKTERRTKLDNSPFPGIASCIFIYGLKYQTGISG